MGDVVRQYLVRVVGDGEIGLRPRGLGDLENGGDA